MPDPIRYAAIKAVERIEGLHPDPTVEQYADAVLTGVSAAAFPIFGAIIATHAGCGRGATVTIETSLTAGIGTGSLHYPCGITVPHVRGLVDAEQRHLAQALAAALINPGGTDART